MLALWLVSLRLRDVSFVDAIWPLGMVALGWLSWARISDHGIASKIIIALLTFWGLRLGAHLFIRWRKMGEDPRYASIMARSDNWPLTALIKIFLFQGVLLWLVSLPAQIGILLNSEAGRITWIGAGLALIGIGFEAIGDWQLSRFRNDSKNKGKVLNSGLWRYTRHPNYFGDACVWWGFWLITAESRNVWAMISIIGPIFLTFTLVRWSGAALLESGLKRTRPEYADYIARTPAFIPWIPRR